MKNDRDLSGSLREAIRRSGLNPNQLQSATGVLSDSISRFVRGEQSLRLEAADKIATFLGIRVVLVARTERSPIVLQAKDYVNAVIDQYNSVKLGMKIPHTGAHFVTLHKFCDGEKIQALFKRIGRAPEIQVGVVLDSNNAVRNRDAAKPYLKRLADEIASGRLGSVPTATGVNVGILRRIPISADTPLPELAKQVVAEAEYILGRLGAA